MGCGKEREWASVAAVSKNLGANILSCLCMILIKLGQRNVHLKTALCHIIYNTCLANLWIQHSSHRREVPNPNEWFRQHCHQFSTGAAEAISHFNQKPPSTCMALSFFALGLLKLTKNEQSLPAFTPLPPLGGAFEQRFAESWAVISQHSFSSVSFFFF